MPQGLEYVFFTDSGSEAADTPLKIAGAYWRHRGKPGKTLLVGREKGYHGVNFGGNRKLFGASVAVDHLPHTMKRTAPFTRAGCRRVGKNWPMS